LIIAIFAYATGFIRGAWGWPLLEARWELRWLGLVISPQLGTLLITSVLLILGLSLLAIEILILPGVGLIGFLGATITVVSGAIAYRELSPMLMVITAMTGAGVFVLLLWRLPTSRLGDALVLRTRLSGSSFPERSAVAVGSIGKVSTPLRPTGTMELNGARIDVVSSGGYIDVGSRVEVIKASGNRIVVSVL